MFFSTPNHPPYIIAGPCSAETREQVRATMQAVADVGASLFRAGVWKPRTRPGSFEGHGEKALEWLSEARAAYGLPYAIEVAETEHVALAVEYKADAVWIGARTTVNPFQVQKLAEALKGADIPVLIKNPVNPDIELWLGAIERFEKMGIKDVGAIHRGFSGYATTSGYRNPPNWPVPIELKRRRPDIPLICDPSHITGNSDKVAAIAQKAMDMRYDGLMIETHPDPAHALTDAAQQITPQQLKTLLHNLIIRKEFTADLQGQNDLENLRRHIDTIDQEIIDLLGRRMELSAQIGTIKKQCNMTVYQPERWRHITDVTAQRAQVHGLDGGFIHALYERIHHESIRQQLQVLQAKEIKA